MAAKMKSAPAPAAQGPMSLADLMNPPEPAPMKQRKKGGKKFPVKS